MNDLVMSRRAGSARPLRSRPGFGLLALFSVLVAACEDDAIIEEPVPGGSDEPVEGGASPALRDPVTLSDDDVARAALGVLGSSAVDAEGSCSNCHTLGRPTLTRWSG